MIGAGIAHLTFARREFVAQVPESLPLSDDAIVLGSGVAEIALGAAMMLPTPKHRRLAGWALAAFYVAIFPGNISQYLTRTDAFGLDTDEKRFGRLFFQPVLVAAALWSSGAASSKGRRELYHLAKKLTK